MRIDRRAARVIWSATTLVALSLAACGPLWAADDVALDILDAAKAPWQRVSPVEIITLDKLADTDARLAEAAANYEVAVCASTRFAAPGDGEVEVTLLEMASPLDALGVFASGRPEESQRVALASPAYWHEGTLRLFTGRWYMQLRPSRDDERGLGTAQQLALQLEMRFPATANLPRMMRVMPHRYLNPYLLHWGLMDFCADGQMWQTLASTRIIGDQSLTISIVECADEVEARDVWTRLLDAALKNGPAFDTPGLGEEGFTGNGSNEDICTAMWQDEFVAVATGQAARADAEALLRIVGMRIRTTRPLPQVASGE